MGETCATCGLEFREGERRYTGEHDLGICIARLRAELVEYRTRAERAEIAQVETAATDWQIRAERAEAALAEARQMLERFHARADAAEAALEDWRAAFVAIYEYQQAGEPRDADTRNAGDHGPGRCEEFGHKREDCPLIRRDSYRDL